MMTCRTIRLIVLLAACPHDITRDGLYQNQYLVLFEELRLNVVVAINNGCFLEAKKKEKKTDNTFLF